MRRGAIDTSMDFLPTKNSTNCENVTLDRDSANVVSNLFARALKLNSQEHNKKKVALDVQEYLVAFEHVRKEIPALAIADYRDVIYQYQCNAEVSGIDSDGFTLAVKLILARTVPDVTVMVNAHATISNGEADITAIQNDLSVETPEIEVVAEDSHRLDTTRPPPQRKSKSNIGSNIPQKTETPFARLDNGSNACSIVVDDDDLASCIAETRHTKDSENLQLNVPKLEMRSMSSTSNGSVGSHVRTLGRKIGQWFGVIPPGEGMWIKIICRFDFCI